MTNTERSRTDTKTHREHVADAIRYERSAQWSAASKSWGAAAKAYANEPRRARVAPRQSNHGSREALEPGTVLRHVHRKRVLATCVYEGEGRFVFDGKAYPTATAAAGAAATSLGRKAFANDGRCQINGWVFWGVEKREEWRRDKGGVK